MNEVDLRKPARNLAESIHSLLGFKAQLTSAWVSSVCSIIRKLPKESTLAEQSVAHKDYEENNPVENGVAEELELLISSLNELNAQRRQLLTEFLDLRGNIRVFCRIRPKVAQCDFNKLSTVVALNSNDLLLQVTANKSKHYIFDKVFQQNSSQDEVFSDIEPIIKSVIDGHNTCIFAYGQTGSGKTYTMEGTPESPGVVQRGIEALFIQAKVSNQEFIITFSMLEIYLGNLKDLLVPLSSRTSNFVPSCLSVQTDPKGGIEINNLTSIQVSDSEQALKLYALGCQLRSTASTNLNKTSSRSHCMIRIKIIAINALERRRETSKLWMVDLGGSERVLKTKAQGRRFEEGKAINLSLSALGDVVDALQNKRCHIPYRNSKLTLVLQDCLGEDSNTLMLVHVSPEEEDLCESVCSLNFATRARSIHLDSKESKEVKERKKVALTSLQQKMEQVEDERQVIKNKIEKINATAGSLAASSDLPSTQLTGDTQLFMVASKSDTYSNDNIKSMRKFPSLELPRFMQPTVCSTRKSGAGVTFLEDRLKASARRRRSISHRANSVSFPLKRNAAYSSDLSTSIVVDLNMVSNVDTETEHSHDTSECDTRTTDFQIHGKISNFRAHQIHLPKTTGNYPRRQWESTWPIDKQNFEVKEDKWKGGLSLPGHIACCLELPINCNDTDCRDECHLNRTPRMESPKSFSMKVSGELCHSTGNETWTQHQESENGFPKVDIDTSSQSFADVGSEYTSTNCLSDTEESLPAIYNDIKHSNDLITHTPDLQCEKYAEFSESVGDSQTILNTVIKIPKTCCGASAKKSVSEIMDTQFDVLVKETIPCLHRSQCHRALFTDKLQQDKVKINAPIDNSQVILRVTGLIISIKLKIQMMYFCTLLWLGFWNLGYEDDFFHSLTQ